MAKINIINQLSQWQAIWDNLKESNSPVVLLLKLSPICPTSHRAEAIFNRFVAELPENAQLQICSVNVIAARPVSQRIASDTGIRHESPQAFLFKSGQQVTWHASHDEINAIALKKTCLPSTACD